MDTKDTIEACMKQAEYYANLHDHRREYEWKITLGFWAAILASIQVMKGKDVEWWVGLILLLGYSFLWLRGIWVANENDKSRARHFRQHAEMLLLDPTHRLSPSPGRVSGGRIVFGFLGDWSMLFQMAATAVLLFLAYRFIS
jgi:hypothetical protein